MQVALPFWIIELWQMDCERCTQSKSLEYVSQLSEPRSSPRYRELFESAEPKCGESNGYGRWDWT